MKHPVATHPDRRDGGHSDRRVHGRDVCRVPEKLAGSIPRGNRNRSTGNEDSLISGLGFDPGIAAPGLSARP